MSVYGIDMGHPDNCGANGFMSETNGNRAVGNILITRLRANGDTVIDCTIRDNNNELERRVAKANAQHLDYFISLHMDCYSKSTANGATIYTTEGSRAKGKAQEIINLVAGSCGYNNRGWKDSNFYVLKYTDFPAMLIEMGFVSNQGDCNKFNAESLANAIFKGLTGHEIVTTPIVDNWRNENKTYIKERINMARIFSETFYRDAYPNVLDAINKGDYTSGYQHYVRCGKEQGYKPHAEIPADFSNAGYLYNNEDVANAVDKNDYSSGLDHWLEVGWKEDRSYIMPSRSINAIATDDSTKETFYRVVTGSYKERLNADEQIAKLKSSGFESFVAIYKK